MVDSKGRVHVENVDGLLRLIFDNVKKEDQGKWTCLLEGEFSEEKYFTLNVYAPISLTVDSMLTINEGQDATLRCEASGFPDPKIHWYFNGLSLMDKILSNF